jgi:hypothetical protein
MEKDNILLNGNCIPICSDIFNIILSDLDLKSVINFSMSCRNHREISENNFIWMNQMIKLCPAFKVCCECGGYYNNRIKNMNKIKYKEVVKEIIYMKRSKWLETNFFDNKLSKIIVSPLFYKFDDFINIRYMLNNYLNCCPIIFNKLNLDRLFLKCCIHGNIEIARLILNNKKEFNNFPDYRISEFLLYRAFESIIRSNNQEILILLLEYINHRKDIFSLERKSLFQGDFDLRFIYELKQNYQIINDVLKMIFSDACFHGTKEILKILLEYSVKFPEIFDVRTQNDYSFYLVCRSRDIKIIKFLFEYLVSHNLVSKGQYDAVFIWCCRDENTEVIKLLLDFSKNYPEIINPEAQNNEALVGPCGGASEASIEIVKLLLDHKLKSVSNFKAGPNNISNFFDNYALYFACQNARNNSKGVEIVKLLLNFNLKLEINNNIIPINKIEDGLNRALVTDHPEILKLLLDYIDKYSLNIDIGKLKNDKINFNSIHGEEMLKILDEYLKKIKK